MNSKKKCYELFATKKMIVIITQSWMFTYDQVWSQTILVLLIYGGHNPFYQP